MPLVPKSFIVEMSKLNQAHLELCKSLAFLANDLHGNGRMSAEHDINVEEVVYAANKVCEKQRIFKERLMEEKVQRLRI